MYLLFQMNIMSFAATRMDLESGIPREAISCDILYVWNLRRNDTNELTKQKQTHKLREATYGGQGK